MRLESSLVPRDWTRVITHATPLNLFPSHGARLLEYETILANSHNNEDTSSLSGHFSDGELGRSDPSLPSSSIPLFCT